jgi:hypothetical protein
MNDFELGRQRREQRALERLGSNNPSCVICGCDDPFALELHHIAGRAFDDETVRVCRNCHARLTDHQRDHSPAKPAGGLVEPIRRFLLGLADLFEMLVKRLREFATSLADLDGAGHSQNGEVQP